MASQVYTMNWESKNQKEEVESVPSSLTPPDPAAMKRLTRKVDIHVIPPLFVIFLLAFLDRTNIGNARIQGLEASLHMTGKNDYNIALFIFFIPYITLEVPANIIIKKVSPSTWLSAIMVGWGIATVCQGVVTNLGGLVACRTIVGVFEAGLFPGCVYLISMYYEKFEFQWRLSLFFTASIVAGAFGGLLAYAIAKMDGVAGYAGWRWIFILEGLLTVVLGALSKFWIVDWPETAKFLNEEERAMLVQKLAVDMGPGRMDRLDKRSARRVFADWKIWCGTFMYMGIVTTSYSSSFFIPTILKQMGYTSARAQLYTIPIYVAATIGAITVAYFTDRLRHRFSFVMAGTAVAALGMILLLCLLSIPVGARYFACFAITVGAYMAQPVTLAWLSNQMGGHYKRSMAAALQIGIGNCGGIIASNIFLKSEAPTYHTGFGTALGMQCLCAIMAIVMYFGLKAENKKRDRGERDHRYEEADIDNMGDDHPSFRFTT